MTVVKEFLYRKCRICVHDDAIVAEPAEIREILGEAAGICGKKAVEIEKKTAPSE